MFLFPGKKPKFEMLGIFQKIFYFIGKKVDVDGEEKGFGKNAAAGGKDKKRNKSNDNLKKIVVKNEVIVIKMGGFKEF